MITATTNGQPLVLEYTKMQEEVYLTSTGKYVIVPAGRRSGKTRGGAQFFIDTMLDPSTHMNLLWCEVSYAQILSYFDRYFRPILNQLNPVIWSWNQQRRNLHVLGNILSFRSADRPDLLVGLSYNKAIINEAGIQLYEDSNIWTQIIMPMLLDDPDSRAWLVGTPRGFTNKNAEDNLFYTMFVKGKSDNDPKYQSFTYTSYDNPKLRKEDIEELEKEIPPLLRAQEIFAEFVNVAEIQIFNSEWFHIVEDLPTPPNFYKKFITIDSAFSEKDSSDESAMLVIIKCFDGHFYIIDADHGHYNYPDLVSKTKEFIQKHSPDSVCIENRASGQSLIQSLRRDLPEVHVVKYPPDGVKQADKVTRATACTSIMEQKRVHLLNRSWNKDLINQCVTFPLGSRDDLVDALSQGLLYAKLDEDRSNPFVTRKITPTANKSSEPGTPIIRRTFTKDLFQGYGSGPSLKEEMLRGYR